MRHPVDLLVIVKAAPDPISLDGLHGLAKAGGKIGREKLSDGLAKAGCLYENLMLARAIVVGNTAPLGIQLKHKIRNRPQHGSLAVTVRLQLGLGDARLLLGIAPEQQHVDRIGDRLHQAQRIRRKAARAQRAVKADTARELSVPAHGGRHHRFDTLLLQNAACWQLFGQRVDILDGNRARFFQLIMPRVQQPKGQILADVQRHRNTRRGPFMRGADLAGRLQPTDIAAPHPNQLADPRQRKIDMRINIWPLMPQ